MVKRRKDSKTPCEPTSEQVAALAAASAQPGAAYAPALDAGFQAMARHVQEMHQAISSHAFGSLLSVPGLSVPTRVVQGVHDAISHGVYAAVRRSGGAVLALAGNVERQAGDPTRVPGQTEQTFRSALNGVFGDALAAMSNPLAIEMGLYANGQPIEPTRDALAGVRSRLVVFLHGLSCDERSWSGRREVWADSPWGKLLPAGQALQYGSMLEREFPVSAICLRYNTGLAIDANAQAFSDLLSQLAKMAPQVKEIVLIGHSMGGLVARRSLELAVEAGEGWALSVRLLICLGSPNQGAALEKVGALASTALSLTQTTQPLAKIANARSVGIKDLGRGLKRPARGASAHRSSLALKLVFGTLGDDDDSALGALIGKVLGDGLVHAASASDEGAQGDIERCELAGLGHMALLSHPRVYALIRRWLGA